jgi:hypothetical protein
VSGCCEKNPVVTVEFLLNGQWSFVLREIVRDNGHLGREPTTARLQDDR